MLDLLGSHPRIIQSMGPAEHGLLLELLSNGNAHDYLSAHPSVPLDRRLAWCVQVVADLEAIRAAVACGQSPEIHACPPHEHEQPQVAKRTSWRGRHHAVSRFWWVRRDTIQEPEVTCHTRRLSWPSVVKRVRWCSWLSRQSNTLKVSSSNLDRISLAFADFCDSTIPESAPHYLHRNLRFPSRHDG